ncbi:MAG TPA: hemolysin family protein [Methylomirabilota bacterium]|nr:hemolysin family protein [Methylomirabilota bacterium]
MTDTEAQSSAAAANGHAPGGADNGTPHPTAGWLSRLREAIGFKTSATLRENLELALDQEDALDAAFSPEERAMIRNILRLRETRVDDVMVPRADIDAVEVDITLSELLTAFQASGHSRMPVYRETLDDAIGMVHIKDLMAYITDRARQPVEGADAEAGKTRLDVGSVDLDLSLDRSELVRPVLFVPPSMPATDLLAKMQATHTQMALVIDEYGGTDGLVSIEDVVETIVGEIDDEHDEDDGPMVQAVTPGVFVADARADLEEVIEVVGPSFEVGAYDEEVDTIGGLLFSIFGRIPARGEVLTSGELPGWEIEVLEADPRRIKKVRMIEKAPGAAVTAPPLPLPEQATGTGP